MLPACTTKKRIGVFALDLTKCLRSHPATRPSGARRSRSGSWFLVAPCDGPCRNASDDRSLICQGLVSMFPAARFGCGTLPARRVGCVRRDLVARFLSSPRRSPIHHSQQAKWSPVPSQSSTCLRSPSHRRTWRISTGSSRRRVGRTSSSCSTPVRLLHFLPTLSGHKGLADALLPDDRLVARGHVLPPLEGTRDQGTEGRSREDWQAYGRDL